MRPLDANPLNFGTYGNGHPQMGVVTGNLGGSLGLGGIGGIDGGNALTVNHSVAIKKSELVCRGHPLKCAWSPRSDNKRSSVSANDKTHHRNIAPNLYDRHYARGISSIGNLVVNPLNHHLHRRHYSLLDRNGHNIRRGRNIRMKTTRRRRKRRDLIEQFSSNNIPSVLNPEVSTGKLYHHDAVKKSLIDGTYYANGFDDDFGGGNRVRRSLPNDPYSNPENTIFHGRMIRSSVYPAPKINKNNNIQLETPKQVSAIARNYVIRPVHRKPPSSDTQGESSTATSSPSSDPLKSTLPSMPSLMSASSDDASNIGKTSTATMATMSATASPSSNDLASSRSTSPIFNVNPKPYAGANMVSAIDNLLTQRLSNAQKFGPAVIGKCNF